MKFRSLVIFLCMALPLSSAAQANAINEEKFITIGGIQQWITIRETIAQSLSFCFCMEVPAAS